MGNHVNMRSVDIWAVFVVKLRTIASSSFNLCTKLLTEAGTGKPEALKHDFAGYWSRRISGEHRLVYRFEANLVHVIQCRYHYTAK